MQKDINEANFSACNAYSNASFSKTEIEKFKEEVKALKKQVAELSTKKDGE